MLEDVEGSTPPVRDVATVEMFRDMDHQRVLAVGENPRITDLDPEIRHPAGGRAGHDPLQVPRDPEVRLVVQSAGVHVLDVDLLSTCSELLQDGSLDEQTGGEHEKKSHPMIRYSENYGSERQVATEECQATSPGNTSVISREISDQKWHREPAKKSPWQCSCLKSLIRRSISSSLIPDQRVTSPERKNTSTRNTPVMMTSG